MPGFEGHSAIREAARSFEEALPAIQRKELGQFFTGMPLGRILANLAVGKETRSLIDPMAGSGDLLDAALEVAIDLGVGVNRLDAVEIDEPTAAICKRRLQDVCKAREISPSVIQGDAFSDDNLSVLPQPGYDLVITNPPYVRYQSLNGRADSVRQGLLSMIESRLPGSARGIWKALAAGYSGLADLSVPAWLLSAALVSPGGQLALVVPATWRTRAYADVIRYLLLRLFELELIVEDTQPGWFSDALVRTHLIVARRLTDDEASKPLTEREAWRDALWVQVAPEASTERSLVGGAFPGEKPEADFARWCRDPDRSDVAGMAARRFSLEAEWRALWQQAAGRSWIKDLEQSAPKEARSGKIYSVAASVPEAVRDLLPPTFDGSHLQGLDDGGIRTGQGLRSGCNRFFYVELLKEYGGECLVEVDNALGGNILSVPSSALRPVLHRQSDLNAWSGGHPPATRVFDLRRMILPEDMSAIRDMWCDDRLPQETLPDVMPDELAAHVRYAGAETLGSAENARPVSELSAVRTNVRAARGGALPRFWYMLPDFMPRHLPQVFVPRIIHETPRVYENSEPPILIDANFSTFWDDRDRWTPGGLAAFLNSAWCRAIMEATGTPLGGGALKLEAVHLRRMPVPRLESRMVKSLNEAGQCEDAAQTSRRADRILLRALLRGNPSDDEIDRFAGALDERRKLLGATRQRGAA